MKKVREAEPLVSVLVPIYNVEKYLRQCLESLRGQTLQEIEFICINDGSKDGSLEIIKEFVAQDKRFRLIDKENSGYGDSMNLGLKEARGKYIGIVESDDWVDTKAFAELTKLAEESGAEIVRANYYQNKGGRNLKMRTIPIYETNRIINPRHHTWLFLLPPAIWSAIYRKDFLEQNDVKFLPTPGASYQDTGFAFKAWAAAKKVWLTTNAYLHYRIDNEASSVNHPGKAFCICEEYAEIERYLRERDDFDDLGTIMWIGKAGTYYWNAFRLDKKLLREFLEKVMPEVRAATEDGITFVEYFDEDINMSKSTIAKLTRALAKGKTRKAERIIVRDRKYGRKIERREQSKLHPYRTKAFTTEKLVTKLEEQSELLEQQIRNLRAKMEQTNEEE